MTPATELRGGRYVLLKTLGEGSQGETFEAVDKREGRLVAIKRFRVGKAKAWKDVELAEREATTLASLAHELLPRYVEHFEEDGALVLVMERIEGESLAALRKGTYRASVADVRRLLDDASRALAYLHGQEPPVVHRDLKPANVIRRPDGSFAFVDFGAVRDRLKPAGGSTVVGTFGYMAPEQFQGRASPASDVYGIGATALSMLTGEEPEDLPHKGLAIDVVKALPPSTPQSLVRTLGAMLDPDPDTRASSIEEALARGGAAHLSQRAPPPPPPLGVLAWLSLLFSRLLAFLGVRALEEAPRVRVAPAADVLRQVRAVRPQEEVQRIVEREGLEDAEAWADRKATEEAERWHPPEAWVEREAREAEEAEAKRKAAKRRS